MSRKQSHYETIVFDLDGTLFVGNRPIAGASEAIEELRHHFTCRFLSNNGERTGTLLADRLNAMGFDVAPEEIISSADLVVDFLGETKPGARVLVRGSDNLAHALASHNFCVVDSGAADFVVIGVDRDLTRHKMVAAFRSLHEGARLIATNADPTYPASDGERPAAGAYVGLFRGMGYEPMRFCGKPDLLAVRTTLRKWGIEDPATCLFVGDNLRTDIAAADVVGADSVLVLSGVATAADVARSDIAPTYVIQDISVLPDELSEYRPRERSRRKASTCCANAKEEK